MAAYQSHGSDAGNMLNPKLRPKLRKAPLCYRQAPGNNHTKSFAPAEKFFVVAALMATAGFATLCFAIA